VWRYQWEITYQPDYKDTLLTYNAEDCQALKYLTDEISKIQQSADTSSQVEFANKPQRYTTDIGQQIHSQFETMLKFAHSNYDKRKIKFRQDEKEIREKWQKEKSTGKEKYSKRRKPKPIATKSIQVPSAKYCTVCGNTALKNTKYISKKLIVDLVLTKSGVRKTIIEYIGIVVSCSKCGKTDLPQQSQKYGRNQLYGRGFKIWIAYLRVSLRLSYLAIRQSIDDVFNVKIDQSSTIKYLQDISHDYIETESLNIQKMLQSPFIHADETRINIQGTNWYVWVFTDGSHVIFKLNETRESIIAHQILDGYDGVLISDFYPGYDSLKCRQQKCLVHLVRDLNDDLWSNPFDNEYEMFVSEVRNLIIPIMETIQKYGLKKRNLYKFKNRVYQFYKKVINGKPYKSELVITYKKRFIRYQESLFTFLEQDGIPWHNNTAEHAIRHFAIHRDQSRDLFRESVTHDYLRLLGIKQTCRYQNKSFLRFLFSEQIDLDKFEARKRRR
jgi:hypothetical protein